jgi:prepilin-type N-terminal cleavage/methylation domain-containing protein/prepilin-type processing-associated H-X9-DG protein
MNHSPESARVAPSFRKSKGFTLIELLVVIAIIAILASILFPVFGRARENARRSSCLSNMKQIGLGIMQYTQDYDEKLPMRRYGTAGGEIFSWRRTIYPYVKSVQVFACPSNTSNSSYTDDSSNTTTMSSMGVDPLTQPRFPRSYGVNGTSVNIAGTAPFEYGNAQPLAAFPDVARTILVAENKEGNTHMPFDDSNAARFENANDVFQGHLGTVIFAFADGHSKAMKPIATGTPTNMWNIEEVEDVPGANGNLAALQSRLGYWQKFISR